MKRQTGVSGRWVGACESSCENNASVHLLIIVVQFNQSVEQIFIIETRESNN